ncbi:MAG: serine/threonine-protein kinase [Polyangiaceae bacterium]
MTQESTSPPSFLGRYRLLRAIGHGGMADVFLAVSQGPAGFSKLAVIKQLRPALAFDPAYVEMFLDEARLSARLHHPHIVQTNEVGETDGRYFMAMEYLDGQPLHKVLQRSVREPGSLPLEVHLRILADVLAGLHCAHELRDLDGSLLGIVHRDATPQNVFVTYDGQVKVLDFGIAKMPDAASQTATGTFKGKVAYVSPEQAAGGPIDRRADIFSVGVMLWEASTGRRMWGNMSEVEILLAISQGKIPDPSEVDPGVPSSLARICMKALALRPEDRFDTAAEMQLELERLANAIGERVGTREIGRLVSELFRNERRAQREMLEQQLREIRASGPSSQPQLGPVEGIDSSRTPVSRTTPKSTARGPSGSTEIALATPDLEATRVEATPAHQKAKGQSKLALGLSVVAILALGGVGWKKRSAYSEQAQSQNPKILEAVSRVPWSDSLPSKRAMLPRNRRGARL